ncbi:hypothetical protein SDC9_181665 [bioreactor metagenome]|uniref:Uncharacterized protein n=1 Tax=bioreactor metagenome TaxID=1076179 RepID=A0A645H740_9ZZZZ
MNGHGYKLPDRVDHRHYAHIQVAAPMHQGGVAHHLGQAVGERHEEARQTQGDNPLDSARLQLQGLPAQPQGRTPACQKKQHPNRRGALTDDGGQGRAPDSHIQSKNENRIQYNVEHRAQRHREHADPAEALGVDKGIEAQTDHHKQRAQQVHAQIGVGVYNGHVAGPKQKENRPAE